MKPRVKGRPTHRWRAVLLLPPLLLLGTAGTLDAQEPPVYRPPLVVSTVAPELPTGVTLDDPDATVVVEVTVDVDGAVTEASVAESTGEPLDRAAVEAVRQWRFQPATFGDTPVVSRLPVTVRFAAPAPAATAPSEPVDDLEAELAAEMAERQVEEEAPVGGGSNLPAPRSSWASARGLSNVFNPAISANGLVLVGWSSREGHEDDGEDGHDHEHGNGDLETGLFLQEVEVRLSAIVDPYFRADFTLSAHLDEIGFEEAYVSTLFIPRMTIRAGQMYAAFGRHNELHTHAFPFLTGPLPWRDLLSPEALNAPGISFDILLPLPFYTELNLQAFGADWRPFVGSVPDDPETPQDELVPDARQNHDFAYVAHIETLFELGDSTTLELGGSYVGGKNGFDGWTNVVGADLTVKWRPIEAERYTSFAWISEYLWDDRAGAPYDERVGGAYTSLLYQFAQRWWIQGHSAILGLPPGDEGRTWRFEALLAFVPSELSILRLQYAYERPEDGDDDPVHELFLQTNFSIGSHPAHAY